MKVVACYHLKGGVGKTASAVNLGFLAATRGLRTLIWDLDPQGATSYYFRVKPRVAGGWKALLRRKGNPRDAIRATDYEGLDLLPADFSARHVDVLLDHARKPRQRFAQVLRRLRKQYDLVLFDCAPSIGLGSESMFRAADALLVPVIPTTLSLHSLDRVRRHLRGIRKAPPIWPFFSMVDRRKSLHRELLEAGRTEIPGLLSAGIPYSSHVERMGVQRAPLPTYAPKSPVTRAYEQLLEELLERLFGSERADTD